MNKTLSYLQIARGIAALIVVLHHISAAEIFYFSFYSFAGVFIAGWNAVDFFFVLSGFIIYYIHARDLGHREKWRHYMSKRLIRIYPIYWVVALLSLALLIAGSSHVSRSDVSNISAKPLYILKSFLLIPQAVSPFVGVAWSLCYEMFFYLVFGLGILFNRKILWLFPIIYLGANVYQALVPGNPGNWTLLTFLSSHSQVEFMLGIVTAYCFNALMEKKKVSPAYLSVLRWTWIPGLLLFAGAWYVSVVREAGYGRPSLYNTLSYGISSGLIILGIAQWKLTRDNMTTRFFLLLGDASFSLYLIHPLVLGILFKFFMRIGISGKIGWLNYGLYPVAAGCCVLTGILLHKKIEKPILSLLNKALPGKVIPAAHR